MRVQLPSIMLVLVLLAGCRSQQDRPPAPGPRGSTAADKSAGTGAPALSELENLIYRGLALAPGPVPLVDGEWEGEPLSPGGASRPRVHFVRDFHLLGDVDGDGEHEAVVLLSASGGGTGEDIHLAVVARRDGRLQNTATALVGDRVQLRSGCIEAGRIVLDVVQAGANDAMCCPGDMVRRAWKVTPSGLEESAPVSTGRLSLAALTGTDWVLRSWAWNEAAAAEPEVTLVVEGDRFTGVSGCNRYFAQVVSGSMPGDVSVGPAAGTRMACPEPAAGVESRFLAQLAGVKKFGFMAGQLALSYEKDGVFDTMLFAGRTTQGE